MPSIKQTYSNLHPALRWTIILLGGLIIVLLIIQILFTLFAEDYVADRIETSVQQASGGAYNLEFDEPDIGLWSRSIEFENISISTDSSLWSDTLSTEQKLTLDGSVQYIAIQGVNLWAYFFKNELIIDKITITGPTFAVGKRSSSNQEESESTTIDSLIYEAISSDFEALQIDQFSVNNADFALLAANTSKDTLTAADQFNLNLNNIRIDAVSAQSGRTFITGDFSLQVENFMMNLPDSLNTIAFNELNVDSDEQIISVDSLEIIPRYPRFEFGRVNGYEIDRIDLVIPEITVQKIDFSEWVNSGRFHADKLLIDDLKMIDFRNKNLPFSPNQNPPLPHIALRDMEQSLKIDTIQVSNAYIAYNEYWYNAPQAGTVTFEHLNATITNVTNYPELIEEGIIMKMDASAEVMGKALLTTRFEFPMNTEIGFHKVDGSLTTMPITALNPMLEYVAFVEVDDGIINSLEFSITFNNQVSNGTLIMNYEGLKISLLDKETMEQQGIIKDVGSFIANVFVIKENNTPEDGMRVGNIEFERVQRKSFFNYWWKSLFSGMKDVIQ